MGWFVSANATSPTRSASAASAINSRMRQNRRSSPLLTDMAGEPRGATGSAAVCQQQTSGQRATTGSGDTHLGIAPHLPLSRLAPPLHAPPVGEPPALPPARRQPPPPRGPRPPPRAREAL